MSNMIFLFIYKMLTLISVSECISESESLFWNQCLLCLLHSLHPTLHSLWLRGQLDVNMYALGRQGTAKPSCNFPMVSQSLIHFNHTFPCGSVVPSSAESLWTLLFHSWQLLCSWPRLHGWPWPVSWHAHEVSSKAGCPRSSTSVPSESGLGLGLRIYSCSILPQWLALLSSFSQLGTQCINLMSEKCDLSSKLKAIKEKTKIA